MSEQLAPERMLPLTPAVFHILLALADGARHGYAIMQEVTEQTEGAVTLGPGTLYGSIKRMLAANLLAETEGPNDPARDDRRRRYYRLTDFGQQVVRAEAARLAALVQQARSKQLLAELGDA